MTTIDRNGAHHSVDGTYAPRTRHESTITLTAAAAPVHLTISRDRDNAYCGVRGEPTTTIGTITCLNCASRLDELGV